jgi:hypothetical protein
MQQSIHNHTTFLQPPCCAPAVVVNGVSTGLDIGLSNYSLMLITLSFYTMCKSTTPVFLLMFAFIWGIERCVEAHSLLRPQAACAAAAAAAAAGQHTCCHWLRHCVSDRWPPAGDAGAPGSTAAALR